jgi:hypothetical protein
MEQEGNMRVQIHTTVQMYNILDITELFDYAKQFGYFPYLNILDHPDYLNVRVLPLHFKECVVEDLQPWIDKPKVQGLINYMMDEDWSQHTEKFVEYTNWLDKSRKQDVLDVIPALEDILEKKEFNV